MKIYNFSFKIKTENKNAKLNAQNIFEKKGKFSLLLNLVNISIRHLKINILIKTSIKIYIFRSDGNLSSYTSYNQHLIKFFVQGYQ